MHCNEYLSLMSGYLDRTNSEQEENLLREHLHSCRHCRELLSQMEADARLLHEPNLLPPTDLSERIMAQIQKKPRRMHRIVGCVLAGAATAAVLFVSLRGILLPSLQQRSTDGALAVQTKAQGASIPENAQLRAVDASDEPVLIVWRCEKADLPLPDELWDAERSDLPTSDDFARFYAALPVDEGDFSVTVYSTTYDVLETTRTALAESYELDAYYPQTDGEYTHGIILLLSEGEN